MDFLKKQRIGFLAYIVVAIMAIISLVVYVMNVNMPYYKDMNTTILMMMVGALIALVGVIMLPLVAKGKVIDIFVDVLRVAATVLIIASGTKFIGMRIESFGYIFGSNLELGNEAAFSAGSQAIVGIVLFIVTWILAVITSFFKIGKKN